MSDSAPLPVHALDASAQLLVLLSAGGVALYRQDSQSLISSLPARVDAAAPVPAQSDEAQWLSFPRLCAIAPSETLVAVTGDDKTLRVWRPDDMRYGAELLKQRLPKRASTLQWTTCTLANGAAGEELVIADKFGDIWSFPVDPANPTPATAAPAPGEEDDAALQPRLGHVSMVTCVGFLGAAGKTPAFVVTCDRDEHVRISRWGQKRAGYVIQQYLLGSRAFVGALAVLPSSITEQTALQTGAGEALLTSDGGEGLRLWTLGADGRYKQHTTLALDRETLARTVRVNADVERRREKAASNPAFKGVFGPSEAAADEVSKRQKRSDGAAAPPPSGASGVPTLVITKLLPFVAAGRTYVLIALEGATAFFTVPLDALAPGAALSHPIAKENLRTCDLGAPILDLALVGAESPHVWACCDERTGLGKGPTLHQCGWAEDKFVKTPAETGTELSPFTDIPAQTHAPRAQASTTELSKLCYYQALMTWPKPPPAGEHDGNAPFTSFYLSQRPEPKAQDMLHRFQSGKRAAGRAKNQAAIQERFGGKSDSDAQPNA